MPAINDQTTAVQPEPAMNSTNVPRRRSSLFSTLYDNHHQPNNVQRRLSLNDQHKTPGFIGRIWHNYIHGSPDAGTK